MRVKRKSAYECFALTFCGWRGAGLMVGWSAPIMRFIISSVTTQINVKLSGMSGSKPEIKHHGQAARRSAVPCEQAADGGRAEPLNFTRRLGYWTWQAGQMKFTLASIFQTDAFKLNPLWKRASCLWKRLTFWRRASKKLLRKNDENIYTGWRWNAETFLHVNPYNCF